MSSQIFCISSISQLLDADKDCEEDQSTNRDAYICHPLVYTFTVIAITGPFVSIIAVTI